MLHSMCVCVCVCVFVCVSLCKCTRVFTCLPKCAHQEVVHVGLQRVGLQLKLRLPFSQFRLLSLHRRQPVRENLCVRVCVCVRESVCVC